MQKKLAILVVIPTLSYAAYNPFFTEDPAPVKVKAAEKVVVKEYKPAPKVARENIKITYFGFVSSYKGEYALVNFNGRNIVINENDSLYNGERIYKIGKITSNYILIKDKIGRAQTVYFSSDVQN